VDALDSIDLNDNVDMDRDGDDEEEEDEVEEDEEDKDEEEEDEEEEEENEEEEEDEEEGKDEDEEEDEDEDDGKEPWTIGQEERVNSSADDVDTIVDDQPIVLPEPGQEICEYTPQPQPPAQAPQPQTPESHPQPRTPETHPLSGLKHLGVATAQKYHLAVPTLREAEAAGNTLDVDVDEQLLIESVGGDSLPSVSLPDVPLPEAPPDGSVGEK